MKKRSLKERVLIKVLDDINNLSLEALRYLHDPELIERIEPKEYSRCLRAIGELLTALPIGIRNNH